MTIASTATPSPCLSSLWGERLTGTLQEEEATEKKGFLSFLFFLHAYVLVLTEPS